jgi:hypothetical protein
MTTTRSQQDAAARRQLEERGVDETRIAELDAGVDAHIEKQRAIARGDES